MKYFLLCSIIIFNLHALDAFISPNELEGSLTNDKLVLIDVSNIQSYKKAHIQGAIHSDVSVFIDDKSLYSQLKPSKIIQNELRKLGINEDSEIVIYSQNTKEDLLNSSYLAFVLIYSGFENISILDGGYLAWVFENELLISSITKEVKKLGNFTVKTNSHIIASSKEVQDSLSSTTILDARSTDLYYGIKRSENINSIGHISHAKSSYYGNKFLTDGKLRNDSELKEMFIDGFGLNQNDKVIVYGDNIFTASMEFYILYKHMGFKNTKIYEASLLEWGNSQTLPMTRFKWE